MQKQYWEAFEVREVHSDDEKERYWNDKGTIAIESIYGPPFRTHLHGIMWNDNKYLIHGYRRMPTKSYKHCLKSMFYMHNETLNIWTHFIPGLIWLFILVFVIPGLYSTFTFMEATIFALYAGACVFVFMSSTIYHTFKCNSIEDYHKFLQIDFFGVVSVMFCGNLFGYFELYCYPTTKSIYLFLTIFGYVFLLIGVPIFVKYRITNLRTFFYIVYVSLGIIFWYYHVHVLEAGKFEEFKFQTLNAIILTYVINISGLIVRTLKYPERAFYGKFNYYFSSHQIFHVLTAIGSFPLFVSYLRIHQNGLFNYACTY